VPRLAEFQARHADISVHVVADNTMRDLERNALDVAIRYSPEAAAGAGAERLFGEHVAPVASPALLKGRGVRTPEDLLQLPLLELDDPALSVPWLSWKVWCEAMKLARPRENRGLAFSHYDQVVQAAIAGQGVALGRFPLVDPFLADGRLALPLKGRRYATQATRAYWLIVPPAAARRAEVKVFTDWLRDQVAAQANGGKRRR
jgi:DNA-binding transcriptional LysR family regulator